MKDAVIFHPARTTGERAGAAVGMEQNELAAEYIESAHPYKQPAEALHIADETRKQTGYVPFPKVTKFNTWLLCRYGKRLEAELTEGIMAGRYAATMGLNGAANAHISCRFSPRMSLWRLNRYEFIADVPVEISWESSAGDETAEGYVSLNCCLDENFCYFIDSVSLEKPDRPLIRLDEYLVPIMSYEDLEAAARTMWEQYLPELFTDHESSSLRVRRRSFPKPIPASRIPMRRAILSTEPLRQPEEAERKTLCLLKSSLARFARPSFTFSSPRASTAATPSTVAPSSSPRAIP